VTLWEERRFVAQLSSGPFFGMTVLIKSPGFPGVYDSNGEL
jgi:hypothetical protein